MLDSILVRPIARSDFLAWRPLWDEYNALRGRSGDHALAPAITEVTWERFFDLDEQVFALVAERGGRLLGLAHYVFHRSTTRIEQTCCLEDLFTAQAERGRGVGRALIHGVYEQARSEGIRRVYWQTHESDRAGRLVGDKVAARSGFIVYTHDA
jgi:GNAT superfamily N-acetyltransferase